MGGKLSKKHQFVLYALMEYLKKLNKRFRDKPLEASVSKIDFIRLLQSLNITEKSQRGLYKNLEVLEKRKLIAYENRFLKLTQRGLKLVQQKESELSPYFRLVVNLERGKVKAAPQTYFK
jgi:hypothetical protein